MVLKIQSLEQNLSKRTAEQSEAQESLTALRSKLQAVEQNLSENQAKLSEAKEEQKSLSSKLNAAEQNLCKRDMELSETKDKLEKASAESEKLKMRCRSIVKSQPLLLWCLRHADLTVELSQTHEDFENLKQKCKKLKSKAEEAESRGKGVLDFVFLHTFFVKRKLSKQSLKSFKLKSSEVVRF